ncbi:MAG: cysteine synthase A [Oscillospiraceae bacterium]
MNIAHSLSDTIGNTPLLHLRKFAPDALIYGKLESMNPLSSAKDRAAYFMILDAEERGVLTADTVIIEPTSGNMGVGLATVAAQKGYHLILTMPETMSVERRSLLAALGAELVLTPGSEGMGGAIKKANELLETLPKAWMPNQFNNPANARAHYETTGPEIWRDTDGALDVFVAGIGSGGTITGAGRYLKERKPDVRIAAVEPADSPVLSGGKPGSHKLQGIGAGFIPGTLDTGIYDEIVTITTEEAFAACRRLAKTEGLLVGISSGAAAAAAVKLSGQYPGQRIVAVLPDTGERYLSTDLFAKDV